MKKILNDVTMREKLENMSMDNAKGLLWKGEEVKVDPKIVEIEAS